MDGMETLTTTEETTVDVDTTETEVDTQGAEDAEPAEPQESEETNEAPEPQVDVNAIAAAARRKAEAEMKARDAEYARRFGNLVNPKTGQPIRSERDYLAALDAQEELKAKEQLKQSGVDPNLLDSFIANNPAVRQAQAVMAQAQQQATIGQINADVAELGKIDPSIVSLETVPPDVIRMSMERQMSLVDAYKIVNFGQVNSSQQAAIQQAAINQAKGKSHLNPVNGVAVQDNSVDIPQSEIARWKAYFPEKSAEELKKLYNDTL
jgi:hypothetical protein